MSIDKSIPIYQIAISNDNISEYYKSLSIESFNKFGYYNIIHYEAIVPDTIPSGPLEFTEKRIYTPKRQREWKEVEKAIWYSHFLLWQKIGKLKTPVIVIEQDCILKKEISSHITKRPIFSFACSMNSHSLAAVGYYITPLAANRMIYRCLSRPNSCPVDGFIHARQPWYPMGILDKQWRDNNVFARHCVNTELGSNKGIIGTSDGRRL